MVATPEWRHTISLGQILTPAVIAITGLWFLFGSDRNAQEALKQVAHLQIVVDDQNKEYSKRMERLESSVAAQTESVKAAMNNGFELMRKQIESMPLVVERISATNAIVREQIDRINLLSLQQSATDRMAYDAAAATKQLQSRIDRLVAHINAPVSLRQNR